MIYHNKGWKYCPNIPIEDVDRKGKSAFITINDYYNDKGRVILCGPHPIMDLHDREGRYIERSVPNGSNCIKYGLYQNS